MSAPHGAAAPVETEDKQEQAEQARPSAIKRLGLQRYAILIVFAAMVISFGIAIPATFLSIGNLSNILGSQAVLFILVMAVMLPTVMGDFRSEERRVGKECRARWVTYHYAKIK